MRRPAIWRLTAVWFAGCLLLITPAPSHAANPAFTNLVAQGDAKNAFKAYAAASPLSTNCADLCLLTKRYCDLMYGSGSPDQQRTLARTALACAFRAEQADPQSATAHLCVTVGYAKNFPYVDNATKVKWSRALKTECETALALDPKQDVGYYLLGRWYFGTANMGFFARGVIKVIYGGLPQASNAEAIKNFKQAIALAPRRIIHHAGLAAVYAATGEKKLELAELETCARLKPLDRDDADAQADAAKRLAEIRQQTH